MLQMEWIYENVEGDTPCGIRELIIALSDAKHESLFSTELIIIICEHFLKKYVKAILYKAFLPWLIYFVFVLIYMSEFAVQGTTYITGGEAVIEAFLRYAIMILAVYLEFFEIICFLRDGYSYFNAFNLIDFVSLALNAYCLFHAND